MLPPQCFLHTKIPPKVKQGQWVEMSRPEVKSLYRMAGLPPKNLKAATGKERDAMERQFGKRRGPGTPRKR